MLKIPKVSHLFKNAVVALCSLHDHCSHTWFVVKVCHCTGPLFWGSAIPKVTVRINVKVTLNATEVTTRKSSYVQFGAFLCSFYNTSLFEWRTLGMADPNFCMSIFVHRSTQLLLGVRLHAIRSWCLRYCMSFDLDYKNSSGVIPNSIEELAYNATAISWTPLNQPVRVRHTYCC